MIPLLFPIIRLNIGCASLLAKPLCLRIFIYPPVSYKQPN